MFIAKIIESDVMINKAKKEKKDNTVYINRDEDEDDTKKKGKKEIFGKEQKFKLFLFKSDNYDEMTKEYDTYSTQKKIELQLAKRSVFNLELDTIEKIDTTEKIHKLGKIDELEKKVLEYQQNWLQKKVWLCEEEIIKLFNHLPDDPYKSKIQKKIKAENITNWLIYGVPSLKIDFTNEEIHELSPQDKIKVLIMYCNLFYLEFKALEKKKRKSLKSRKSDEYEKVYLKKKYNSDTKEWYTDEKGVVNLKELGRLYREELPKDYLFLEHRSYILKDCFRGYDILMKKIFHDKLPKDYPYRKEIKEEIQMVGVMLVEVLELEESFMPINYLQKEKIDVRTERFIPSFLLGKNEHVFNYAILNKDFNTYSPIKKIEVGLANHYVLNLQIDAIQKWRASRNMNECEKAISENRCNILQWELCNWDMKILNTYYEEKLLSKAPYSDKILNKIHKKIKAANIDEESYLLKPIGEPSETADRPPSKMAARLIELLKLRKNFTLKFDELSPQNKIRYRIVLHNLYSAECDMILNNRKNLRDYKKIIFDSKCAELSLRVMQIDDSIHRIFHSDLTREYRKELLEAMKNAKISDNVFHARENFEQTPGYM